jgi:hypothetical protein
MADADNGLTTAEAQLMLARDGQNAIVDVSQHPVRRAIKKLWAPVPGRTIFSMSENSPAGVEVDNVNSLKLFVADMRAEFEESVFVISEYSMIFEVLEHPGRCVEHEAHQIAPPCKASIRRGEWNIASAATMTCKSRKSLSAFMASHLERDVCAAGVRAKPPTAAMRRRGLYQ